MRRSASSVMSCPANKTKKARSSSGREILDLNNTSISSKQQKLVEPMIAEDTQATTTASKNTVAGKEKKDDTSSRTFEKSKIIMTSITQQQGFDNRYSDVSKKITDKGKKAARSVKSVSGIFSTKKVCETFENQASLANARGKISEKHTSKAVGVFTKTSGPVEATGYVDNLPLHNNKNKLIDKAKAKENPPTKHKNPDLSTRKNRAVRKKRRESVEETPVLPPKKRKPQENSSHCALSKKVPNTENDVTSITDLMQIDKIILSLPETSSFLLRSCELGDSTLKCPKCGIVFRQLKSGSRHYSSCKKFKLMKNKKVLVSLSVLVLVCNLCYSTFDELTNLCEHKKVCHLGQSSNVSFESARYGDKYKCKKCSYECFSSFKFKEHSCNKIIEKMQLCSVKIPTLDITQSRKSTLQCFDCTRCCRLFLNINSFNDHMKITHNLEVPATESLKNLTVHNPFCPPTSQIKINNIPINKENSTEKSEKRKHTTCGNNNEKTKQGKVKEPNGDKEKTRHSVSFSINDLVPDATAVQKSRSVKTSRNQSNFSNIETSRSEKTSNCPLNGERIFTFSRESPKTTGCSEDVQWPFLQETICKCRGNPEPEKDIKPCVECLNKTIASSGNENIKPRLDSLNESREEVCAMASESVKTNSNNFRSSGSVTMSNSHTVSSKNQASEIEKIDQAYRRMASESRNLKPTECSEDFEGPYSKKDTCKCQGHPEEDIKPCEECLNKSILSIVEQTMNPQFNALKDSGEKRCSIDNLNTDIASRETLNLDPVYGTQFRCAINDLSNLTTVSPGNRFNSKECEEDNLEMDVVSQRTADSDHSVYSQPLSVGNDYPIPTSESPTNRFNSREEYEEDNLDIDMVSQRTTNSGLVCFHSQSAKDDISIPIYESPGSHLNSREEEGEVDNLDINMVSLKTINSDIVCSQSRSVKNAPLISPINSSSPRNEELGDILDLVPRETLNSGLPHGSHFKSVRDNFLIPGAVSSHNPCNSGGEEECAEGNLDMAPQETLNFVQPIPYQGSTKEMITLLQNEVNCVAMPPESVAAPLKNVANNTDLPESGCNVRLSNSADSSEKVLSGFDEAGPRSVSSNSTESLRCIDDEDFPAFENILDLSKLLTRDRKYESDEDYYACVSKRSQYVTRKLVVQLAEEDVSACECIRIDRSKRWNAEELNVLDIDQITVKHCRTSWGPFNADAHSVIRSHNGENVLSYICDHCFMEFNLDSLKAHLCSLFGRPINNEIKVAYARDNLL